MAEVILTPEQIAAMREYGAVYTTETMFSSLLDSHEELRAEKDKAVSQWGDWQQRCVAAEKQRDALRAHAEALAAEWMEGPYCHCCQMDNYHGKECPVGAYRAAYPRETT